MKKDRADSCLLSVLIRIRQGIVRDAGLTPAQFRELL